MMDVNRLVNLLEVFAEIDPNISMPSVLTFLYIARRGKVVQKDIELALGLSGVATSRNVSYWADMKFRDKPGKGFVERYEDPMNRRFKVIQLTPEGKAFYQKLLESEHGKAKRKQVAG